MQQMRNAQVADTFTHTQQQQIRQILEHEISRAEQLLLALQTETTALGEHTPEPLEVALQTKLEKMQQLEQATNQREQLLNTIVNSNRKSAVLDYGRLFEHNEDLQQRWQSLMALAKRCQQLNHVNGTLVERGYQQSRHALEILHGLTPFGHTDNSINSSDGYDHAGQTTYSNRTHSLAQV